MKRQAPPPPASREVTDSKPPPRHIIPDLDYIADLETAEGQAAIRKRMKQRERGKPVTRPKNMG